MKRLGTPFDVFVSIKPGHQYPTDRQRKAACYKTADNFRKKLRRRNIPDLVIWVFEKTSDQNLHAHLLIHIPKPYLKEVLRWSDPPVVHVRAADEGAVTYITKQSERRSHHDKSHPKSDDKPFIGCRWSVSQPLKPILNRLKQASEAQ